VEVNSGTTKNVYGRVEIKFHSFSISALDAVTGQLYAPTALHLGKELRYPPNTRLDGLRTDPEALENKRIY
jgi:hypothetical protein